MVCACDDGLPCPHDVMRMSDVAPTPRTRRVHNSIFAEIWQLDAEDDGSDFGNLPSNGGCSSSTNIGSSQWTPTSPAGSTNLQRLSQA